jgi:hypothetical protein
MVATPANFEGSSATSFNLLVAHVLPEANHVPTLPHALLRGNLLDQGWVQRKMMDLS